MRGRLPLARPLAALIRGVGAEFLTGDLTEEYRERLEGGGSRAGAELAYLLNVLASLLRWWMPGAFRLRLRNERDGSYDPRRTWRGEGGGGMGDWMTEVRQGVEAAARFSTFLPVQRMGPLTSRIREVRTGPRFNAVLLGRFAAIALLLAAIGLYGSLAQSVGRRTRELGVRVAVGAHPGSIYVLVLRQGLGIAVVGLFLGLAGSVGLVRLLERSLYEVAPFDPTAFAMASFALVAAAMLAVLKPARRAASVDVVECLKAE